MRIQFFGDSVMWGEGLLPEQKFANLVNKAVNGENLDFDQSVFARCGAIIGVGAAAAQSPAMHKEIPDSYPTVTQQVSSFNDNPHTVDTVVINGGINDIDVRTILNPLTTQNGLQEKIVQHCYQDMLALLEQVADKFQNATIIVTSYYPILSTQSQIVKLPHFLHHHGILLDDLEAFSKTVNWVMQEVFAKIIHQCQMFAEQSNVYLKKAVQDINTHIGSQRTYYAQAPFTDSNAALAPEAWLWGICDDLSPEDPMQNQRRTLCDLQKLDLTQLETCYRASVGHPNILGAQAFSDAILALLRPTKELKPYGIPAQGDINQNQVIFGL